MKSIQHWTYINIKINTNVQLFIKIAITAGLTSIREVAALFSVRQIIFVSRQTPDCLLGVVTQPSDSRLSETNPELTAFWKDGKRHWPVYPASINPRVGCLWDVEEVNNKLSYLLLTPPATVGGVTCRPPHPLYTCPRHPVTVQPTTNRCISG